MVRWPMATTKKEIREFIRRAREDIQKLTQALASDKPLQIAIYLNDAESSLDEVRALIEEKYGNAFLEAAVVTYFALTLFLYVQNLPYQSSLKSEIFTIGALILPLIHLLANSFYNVATAEKVS